MELQEKKTSDDISHHLDDSFCTDFNTTDDLFSLTYVVYLTYVGLALEFPSLN